MRDDQADKSDRSDKRDHSGCRESASGENVSLDSLDIYTVTEGHLFTQRDLVEGVCVIEQEYEARDEKRAEREKISIADNIDPPHHPSMVENQDMRTCKVAEKKDRSATDDADGHSCKQEGVHRHPLRPSRQSIDES